MKNEVTQLGLNDIPRVYSNFRYGDGEIYFADNITSIPNLMKVFQVNFVAFVFALEGRLELKLNAQPFSMGANDALFISPNMMVDVVRHSDDFRCLICVVSADMGFNFINKSLFDAAVHISANPVIQFSSDEVMLMTKYYDLLTFKMDHPDMLTGNETVKDLIRCFAYDLLSNMGRHLDDADNLMLRQGDKLYRRFVLLLGENSRITRSVKSYADQLCVSPKYLTSVCRRHGHHTASQIITMATVGRIKRLLLYSDFSIKEVALEMGFENLSFFGKYVKKHLGSSPNNYRKLNGYGK